MGWNFIKMKSISSEQINHPVLNIHHLRNFKWERERERGFEYCDKAQIISWRHLVLLSKAKYRCSCALESAPLGKTTRFCLFLSHTTIIPSTNTLQLSSSPLPPKYHHLHHFYYRHKPLLLLFCNNQTSDMAN